MPPHPLPLPRDSHAPDPPTSRAACPSDVATMHAAWQRSCRNSWVLSSDLLTVAVAVVLRVLRSFGEGLVSGCELAAVLGHARS